MAKDENQAISTLLKFIQSVDAFYQIDRVFIYIKLMQR